jgi:hyperosmotically inducible protein
MRILIGIIGASALAVACGQSDAGITTSVKTQLAADTTVQARQIDVDTRDRVVTLTGEVETIAEEEAALQIARSTDGVSDVIDQLAIVVPADTGTTGVDVVPAASDASITAEVKASLLADPDVAGLKIDVDTNNRMVTLSGTVATEAEKTEALQIARGIAGVSNVTDKLMVGRRQ